MPKSTRSDDAPFKRFVRAPANGGWVKRELGSGKLIAVHSKTGTFLSRPKSEEAAAAASEKRSAALKRLADR